MSAFERWEQLQSFLRDIDNSSILKAVTRARHVAIIREFYSYVRGKRNLALGTQVLIDDTLLADARDFIDHTIREMPGLIREEIQRLQKLLEEIEGGAEV